MLLLLIGIIFVSLGLFSGAILVAAPLGWISLEPSASLWLLFPLFSILGLTLVILGAKIGQIRKVLLTVSCLLLLLSTASAIGLFLLGASVTAAVTNSMSLWFVLAIGGTLGATGIASYSKTSQPSDARQ